MSKFHQLQILENLKNIVTICYDYIDSNGKGGGVGRLLHLKKMYRFLICSMGIWIYKPLLPQFWKMNYDTIMIVLHNIFLFFWMHEPYNINKQIHVHVLYKFINCRQKYLHKSHFAFHLHIHQNIFQCENSMAKLGHLKAKEITCLEYVIENGCL